MCDFICPVKEAAYYQSKRGVYCVCVYGRQDGTAADDGETGASQTLPLCVSSEKKASQEKERKYNHQGERKPEMDE